MYSCIHVHVLNLIEIWSLSQPTKFIIKFSISYVDSCTAKCKRGAGRDELPYEERYLKY